MIDLTFSDVRNRAVTTLLCV
uniref:Uncharacterized protein n=1 Tax=Anguilla anguilla TaxID=7936 RepID=A0A0E9UDS0_ANGAN